MGFKRLLMLIMVIIGVVPSISLAQTPPNPQPELVVSQPVVEQPNTVEVLPIVKWDDINVTVVEGQDAWLALRTDTPINTTSGIKIDIQLYTSNASNGASINQDFDNEITLPQTNQSRNNQITGYITGTSQVLYIQLRTFSDTVNEPNEIFFVDVIVSNGTIESRGNRATITIAKDEKFYPAFAFWQACQDFSEPANNTAAGSGVLAISGGACSSDFIGENPGGVDYYRLSSAVNGNLSLRLKNTTPDQHNFDLYLYKYNPSNSRYELVAQSANANQVDDVISTAIVANTSNNSGLYLVAAYWATSTGSKTPTYELTATMP